jgi:hypothetical protein
MKLLAPQNVCMAPGHIPDRSLALQYQQLNAWPAQVEAQQTSQVSARALQLDCLQAV